MTQKNHYGKGHRLLFHRIVSQAFWQSHCEIVPCMCSDLFVESLHPWAGSTIHGLSGSTNGTTIHGSMSGTGESKVCKLKKILCL